MIKYVRLDLNFNYVLVVGGFTRVIYVLSSVCLYTLTENLYTYTRV